MAFIRAAEKGGRFPAMQTSKSQKWVKRPGEEGAVSAPRGGGSWADISSVERGLSFPEVALGVSFPSAPLLLLCTQPCPTVWFHLKPAGPEGSQGRKSG